MRRILAGYGRGQQPLPVYKMPHLRGWAVAGRHAYLPAIGRHEVLVVDTTTWQEVGPHPVAGQPVFVMARPDGRQVWVNFAVPDYDRVQVIDTPASAWWTPCAPARPCCTWNSHPGGDAVWISCRDDHLVRVIDTARAPDPGHAGGGRPQRHLLHRARPAHGVLTCRPCPTRCACPGQHRFQPSPAQRLSLLNAWQRGFPLCDEPFAVVGAALDLSAAQVLQAYRQLAREGRAQPHWGGVCAGAGGASILSAMAVPPERLEAVAAVVSAHPGVNHNYERENAHNLWFVVTGPSAAQVECTIASLEADTGLTACACPCCSPYRIDLAFDLSSELTTGPQHAAQVGQLRPAAPAVAPRAQLADADWPLAALAGQACPWWPSPMPSGRRPWAPPPRRCRPPCSSGCTPGCSAALAWWCATTSWALPPTP